jgi:hypothetical protein
MSYITTYTGKHFDVACPDVNAIDIRDVAHALSLTCRGNGHVKTFFSVGQHCINCYKEAIARAYPDKVVRACLLHDASEAYMSDVPRPFKKSLADYIRQENKLLDLIYEKYLGAKLTEEEQMLVKSVDDAMCYYDLLELLNERTEGPVPEVKIKLEYAYVPFEQVEEEYLEICRKLGIGEQ